MRNNNTKKKFLWKPGKTNVKLHKMTFCTWHFPNFNHVFTILLKFNIYFLGLPQKIFFGVINPFATEPPVTARADPGPFYPLWRHQFWRSRTTFFANLCRVKRSFKPYQNEHNSVKDTGERSKKIHVTLTWKSCSIAHLPFLSPNPKILKAFLKTLPTKMKPTKCPAREKKWGKKSEKRREDREKAKKVKVKTAVSRNLAFCACPNFAGWYFASGSEGPEVCDL